MRRFVLLTVLTACLAAVSSESRAGFTVQTGLSNVVNTDLGTPGGNVGDSFSVGGAILTADSAPGGIFAAYVPDTPLDPQITGGDLNLFRFNLTGTIVNMAALARLCRRLIIHPTLNCPSTTSFTEGITSEVAGQLAALIPPNPPLTIRL
jgi:hypothetical protein